MHSVLWSYGTQQKRNDKTSNVSAPQIAKSATSNGQAYACMKSTN